MLLLAGSQILCGYVYNAVCVDVKGHFNLRNASSGRKDTVQAEVAERLIILCKLSLALYHMDVNRSLVVGRCGEDLALLGRDRGISLNQARRNAAHGFNR